MGSNLGSIGKISSILDKGTTAVSLAGAVASASVPAGTVATGATAAIASAGAAATIIGLAAIPVIILLSKIFKGADPRQVPASQIQQTFQAAAISLLAIGRAGMLSRSEAQAGMRVFRQKGEEFFDQAPELKEKTGRLGKAGTAGLASLFMVIDAQIASAQRGGVRDDRTADAGGAAVAEIRTRPLELAAARALYTSRNQLGKKWYPESLHASDLLVDQFLGSLVTPVGSAVSLLRGSVLPVLLSSVGVAALAAVGIAAYVRFHR